MTLKEFFYQDENGDVELIYEIEGVHDGMKVTACWEFECHGGKNRMSATVDNRLFVWDDRFNVNDFENPSGQWQRILNLLIENSLLREQLQELKHAKRAESEMS